MFTTRLVFPRLKDVKSIEDLTSTAQTVYATGTNHKIAWGIVAGGAAAEKVIFRAIDDGPEYFRVSVPINDTATFFGFEVDTDEGLEVITESAAGDVDVSFFEVKA